MIPRQLILLSPYRLPAQNSLMLSNEDVSAFLNGYTALWHPAALRGASAAPHVGSPYDYEQPVTGQLFAVPESPPLILPDDWHERVRAAGAASFHATPDRPTTLSNLKEALQSLEESEPAPAGPDPWAAPSGPFFGIGLGYLCVEALFEAMEHENLLAAGELWQDVQNAIAEWGPVTPDGPVAGAPGYKRLQAAAERLQTAREVLYPAAIHLLDVALLDERSLNQPLPATFARGLPLNVIASASLLSRLAPEALAALRERVAADGVEVCGGSFIEREDALLPVESQLWNLTKGMAVYRELLGQEVRVFARQRFAAHPQLPLFLQSVGLSRALLLAFDDAVLPAHRSTVVSWPSPDGKQVEAFTRAPYDADNPQTFFHLTHYLHKSIMQDHAATFALLHRGTAVCPWYEDWLELCRFGPILGQWTTFTRYFNDVTAGEYASAAPADDFHGDYLSERTNNHSEQPVSWFARQVRHRRRIDTAWTLAALQRGVAGKNDSQRLEERLATLEDNLESVESPLTTHQSEELTQVLQAASETLAQRLVSRALQPTPGYLVLNPCSFSRRVALELDDIRSPLPIEGPVKSCQIDADKARLVVEVPALGFAWFPSAGSPGTPPARARMKLATQGSKGTPSVVRNEFFEADIDPDTGGLRAIRDHRTRINRLGQQLVFNPGCTTRAREVKVVSTGPALGEVVSEGAILDEYQKVLATFRQRFRAWLGRPLLEMRVEVYPEVAPEGYPWHAYYGARFAWRDERAMLLRGVNGTSYITNATRPETADYLEVRLGKQSTTIFPGGLPFHQRHGARMLDVILLPQGEQARVFDLAIGIDREHPMQTALGLVTPVPLVPTAKGPPHIGATGWLFHLDAGNLLLTGMKPGADGADTVVARMFECRGSSSSAELHCARDPVRAALIDSRGSVLMDASTQGDCVLFDVAPNDLVQLSVEFGRDSS
jgi:hypothetical protein